MRILAQIVTTLMVVSVPAFADVTIQLQGDEAQAVYNGLIENGMPVDMSSGGTAFVKVLKANDNDTCHLECSAKGGCSGGHYGVCCNEVCD